MTNDIEKTQPKAQEIKMTLPVEPQSDELAQDCAETMQEAPATPAQPTIEFGEHLRAAREKMGLDRKDVAARLRLTERIIIMMEEDKYPSDLPPTFIRGYIRSYGKLLQLPEIQISQAIEPITSKDMSATQTPVTIQKMPINSSNNIVQFFTYALVLTLLGLVGGWWHTHNSNAEKKTTLAVNPIIKPLPATPETTTPPPQLAQVTKTDTPAEANNVAPAKPVTPSETTEPAAAPQQLASKTVKTQKIAPEALTSDDSLEYDDDDYDDDNIYIN